MQEDLPTWVAERVRAVLSDGSVAVLRHIGSVDARLRHRDAGIVQAVGVSAHGLVEDIGPVNTRRVGLVQNPQRRVVLPHETGLVARARRDVRGKERPGPGLRDPDLEPDGHGEQTLELAEDHLLARLGRDTLQEELRRRTRVQMGEESVHARLAPAGELLAEVDVLLQVGHWVIVGALARGAWAKHVCQEGRVANFLLRHELQKISILCVETEGIEVIHGIGSQSVMEQIQFDPLLIQRQRKRLVVKVAHGTVHRCRPVGTNASIGDERRRLWCVKPSVGRVRSGVRGGWSS